VDLAFSDMHPVYRTYDSLSRVKEVHVCMSCAASGLAREVILVQDWTSGR